MKIGILTQPLSANYGGILQNYALQCVLKRMGHEPITINRLVPYFPERGRFYIQLLKNGIKWSLRYHPPRYIDPRKNTLYLRRHISDISQDSQRFIANHITRIDIDENLTPEFCTNHPFDAYIVGSDQVWRPAYSPRIENYYLDFTQGRDVKRIAYAASFGVDSWEYTSVQTQAAAKYVGLFDAVSVREISGIELCNKYLGIGVKQVLDPTMLLYAADYQALFPNKAAPQIGSEGHVVTYILDKTPEKQQITDAVCRLSGLRQTDIGFAAGKYQAIEYWLETLNKASFGITDSFHGSVFSILFHKPFVCIANSDRGLTRFHSLLAMFGLGNRLITKYSAESIQRIIDQPIDFDTVECKLAEYRNDAFRFLAENLK